MFCMAWFMELSRLSNSLGSVCSQRRGRLAAGALRPRLPCSPRIPSLHRHREPFSLRALVSLCEWLRPSIGPTRVLSRVLLCSNTGLSYMRGTERDGPTQWASVSRTSAFLKRFPPNSDPEEEEEGQLWLRTWWEWPLFYQLSSLTNSTAPAAWRRIWWRMEKDWGNLTFSRNKTRTQKLIFKVPIKLNMSQNLYIFFSFL